MRVGGLCSLANSLLCTKNYNQMLASMQAVSENLTLRKKASQASITLLLSSITLHEFEMK